MRADREARCLLHAELVSVPPYQAFACCQEAIAVV
jgi:hypothetical protein